MRTIVAVAAVLSGVISFLATAAAQERAGVITTLNGRASLARSAPPQTLPLKFKDDVFGRDRIATAEESLVRVLLGNKALVTVRELSTFTITEEVQRAVVDLQSGKIGVAAARQLFRPGERLEIRTPNAVAGIRGTLLIAEVLPNGDSLFSVLTGVAEICQSGAASACATVARGERALVSATALRSEPIPAGTDPEVGLRPRGPQHTDAPAETTAGITTRAVQGVIDLVGLVPLPPGLPGFGPPPLQVWPPPILPTQGTSTTLRPAPPPPSQPSPSGQ